MEMTMRWFGKDYDTVTLEQIKQTRYATGIITTLYNKMPGEVWNLDEILAMKKEVEDAGFIWQELRVSMSAMQSRQAERAETMISRHILRHWKISEKQISIWSATTSCRYLTGREQNLTV